MLSCEQCGVDLTEETSLHVFINFGVMVFCSVSCMRKTLVPEEDGEIADEQQAAYQGPWWVPWPPDDVVDAELVDDQLPAVTRELTVSLSGFVEGLGELSRVIEEQEETIRDLQASVQELTELMRQQHGSQQTRDAWIVNRMREIVDEKPKRPWWKFWQD